MESSDLDCLVINELVQGIENANQLKFHLRSTSPPNEALELLLQRIIHSYEKALMILKPNGSDPPQASDPPDKDSEDCSNAPKKRKLRQATWTKQVRVVNSGSGLEGPTDDGFSWRKYGQKDILGAKYPRSYYRCTYRSLRSCPAMKQVQRSDDDPSVFEVTYKGAHTCIGAVQPRASSEERHGEPPQEQNNQTLMDENNVSAVQFPFPCLDGKDHYFPVFSESYLGYESNYFSGFFEGLTGFEQPENSIISGQASTSDSPLGGMEFASEPLEMLYSNFRFDPIGSFSSL